MLFEDFIIMKARIVGQEISNIMNSLNLNIYGINPSVII